MADRAPSQILADAREVLAQARAALDSIAALRDFAFDFVERELRELGVSVIHLDCDGKTSVCLYARTNEAFAENLPTLRIGADAIAREIGAPHG